MQIGANQSTDDVFLLAPKQPNNDDRKIHYCHSKQPEVSTGTRARETLNQSTDATQHKFPSHLFRLASGTQIFSSFAFSFGLPFSRPFRIESTVNGFTYSVKGQPNPSPNNTSRFRTRSYAKRNPIFPLFVLHS
jgi:hypothetical protein